MSELHLNKASIAAGDHCKPLIRAVAIFYNHVYLKCGNVQLSDKVKFNAKNACECHYVESVRIRSYSGPYSGKMWTRITPNTDTFHAVWSTLESAK